MEPVRPAIIGKHPDFGDFIRAGLSGDMAEKIMRWMDTTLARVRNAAGDDWEAFWDQAQATRFWLGREVLGRTAIGVMLPSRDKVGRRYPLMTLALGVGMPPPFQDPADDIMERIENHLNHARGGGPGGAAVLIERLDLSDLPVEGPAPAPVIWAHHPEGDLDTLMRRAALADHAICAKGRSYWWAPARGWRAAAWLGCDGLPGQEALTWLLSGEEAAPPPPQPAAEPLPEAAAPPDADTLAAFDSFDAMPDLPEITVPPAAVHSDDRTWTDDDVPMPSGDALPDIDLPETVPQMDERAAILAGWDDDGADAPTNDDPRRDAT